MRVRPWVQNYAIPVEIPVSAALVSNLVIIKALKRSWKHITDIFQIPKKGIKKKRKSKSREGYRICRYDRFYHGRHLDFRISAMTTSLTSVKWNTRRQQRQSANAKKFKEKKYIILLIFLPIRCRKQRKAFKHQQQLTPPPKLIQKRRLFRRSRVTALKAQQVFPLFLSIS